MKTTMEMWVKVLHGICNMGTRGLPDMCTLGPHASGCTYQADHSVTNTKCNTFTPKIKGIQRVTYVMSPWFEGNIFDVALI